MASSVISHPLPPHGLYSPRNSPGKNTGVGSQSLLQRIFPTQGSNPGLREVNFTKAGSKYAKILSTINSGWLVYYSWNLVPVFSK